MPSNYIERCLKIDELLLVNHARIEDYALFAVEKDENVIGLFDIYEGYPDNHTIRISLLLLGVESRGAGIGMKMLGVIANECRKRGFESLGLTGDLKYPKIDLKMKPKIAHMCYFICLK